MGQGPSHAHAAEPLVIPGADSEPDRRLGEFPDPGFEHRFRVYEIEESSRRRARLILAVAAVFVAFTAADLVSVGVGSEWLGLLALRVLAVIPVLMVGYRFRRDPAEFVEPGGVRVLALVQVHFLACFLVVAWVLPEDGFTHTVGSIIAVLVMAFFVPVGMRIKLALVAAFQVAFVVVGHLRFDTVSTLSIAGALVAASLFSFSVAIENNRARRTEWRAGLVQREINDRLVAQAERAEALRAELHRQATQDSLTGLANRRFFFEEGDDLIALADRRGETVTAVIMDLDGFKKINDSHGHTTGDAVLRAVGAALRSTSRRGELVGRIGGEEFAMVALGLDEAGTSALAERVRAAVAGVRVELGGAAPGGVIGVTTSVGATHLRAGESLAEALSRADRAMYEAKRSGGDRILCHAA